MVIQYNTYSLFLQSKHVKHHCRHLAESETENDKKQTGKNDQTPAQPEPTALFRKRTKLNKNPTTLSGTRPV